MTDPIETLPPGCLPRFVGEGAANVVFEISLPGPGPRKTVFAGQLLRVAKAGTKAHSYQELQAYWAAVVKPIFAPGDLVQQRLVRLGSGIVPRLNAVLARLAPCRRSDFAGSLVADGEFGMLVEDMRRRHDGDVVLDFKPKWLAQSLNAPPSARRCRNCARIAYRRSQRSSGRHRPDMMPADPGGCNGAGGYGTTSSSLCPLDLPECGTDPAALRAVLDSMAATAGLGSETPQYERLAHWLRTNTLFTSLRAAQTAGDKSGEEGGSLPPGKHVNGNDEGGEDASGFPLAMTLRDCTCFVRIPASAAEPVEAKLGDLDKKNSEAKLGYWITIEGLLAGGGFYDAEEEPRQETSCRLERMNPR